MLHINRHLCFLVVSSKAWNGHMESYTHIHTTWNHKLNSQKGQIREQTCQYNETPCLGHYVLDDTLIQLSPLKARKCLSGELQSMTRTVKYSFDSTTGVCKRFLLSLFFSKSCKPHEESSPIQRPTTCYYSLLLGTQPNISSWSFYILTHNLMNTTCDE